MVVLERVHPYFLPHNVVVGFFVLFYLLLLDAVQGLIGTVPTPTPTPHSSFKLAF